MTRHISESIMDVPNTYLGYDYINKYYFITHKETTTARLTAQEVFDILKVFKANTAVTLANILALSTGLETIDNIYYTIEDKGIGIKTIKFNDYAKYALVIDKSILYVMNTEIAYDLSLSFSESTIESDLYDFYNKSLGLNVSTTDIHALFVYLFNNVYSTHVYNSASYITNDSGTITYVYTNILKTTNFDKATPVEYYVTKNPNNINTYTTSVGNIKAITASTKTIQMEQNLPSSVVIGSSVQITNSPLNNGIYTVSSKYVYDNKQYLTVKEGFAQDYIWPNLYHRTIVSGSLILADLGRISSINKNNKTITLSASPIATIAVGDVVLINGVPGFSSNTAYEVAGISGSTITVTDSTQFTSDYTFVSAALALGEPLPDMLLTITESSNETKLPKSDFMLDNNTQLTNYLNLVNNSFSNKIPVPTSTIYNQMNNTIPSYIVIPNLGTAENKIYFEGLYSKVFTETTE